MTFNIVSAPNNKSDVLRKKILNILKDHKFSEDNFEILFIIGGDGFFLSTIQKYLHNKIKIIFINSGTLGFYSFSNFIDKKSIFYAINNDRFINLDLLEVTIDDQNKYFCVNDFAFNNNHTTNFQLKINNVYVQKFFANGFNVSTNLGSTARNKSIGAPIVFPNLSAMIFSEVESIQNRYNTSLQSPLVLNNKTILNIKIENRTKSFGSFLIDGYEINNNNIKNNIKIKMCTSNAKVLIDTSVSGYAKMLRYAFIDKVE